MLDELVKNRLYQSVYIVKLTSGELLVGLVINRTEMGISLYFPYELDNVLTSYCEYSFDRRFEVGLYNCVFIKRPSIDVCDQFFEAVMTDSTDEFRDFVMMLSVQTLSESVAEPSTTTFLH
jgi:hypothetical protein